MSMSADVQKLEPGSDVRLYEVDTTALGGRLFRFHGHMQAGPIIWQGQVYDPVQIEVTGLDIRGDGRPSEPTLKMANVLDGVPQALSALCLQLDDLTGAPVRIIKTFAHYLDAANFPEGNPRAAPVSEEQWWNVEVKADEGHDQITWLLSSPLDMQGQQLPSTQITKLCRWACAGDYRGEACAYVGAAMFGKDDKPTDNPALDRCGGRWSSCKARGNTRRFGGSNGASLIATSR